MGIGVKRRALPASTMNQSDGAGDSSDCAAFTRLEIFLREFSAVGVL
jgi:hypothetical protein